MKHCSRCNIAKPPHEFSRDKRASDGLQSSCQRCYNAYKKVWRAKNKTRLSEANRIWRVNNRSWISDYGKRRRSAKRSELSAYARKWRLENPDKARAKPWTNQQKSHRRRAKLRGSVLAKISKTDWQSILDKFAHRCAYCGGQKRLEQEHVTPLCRGGEHTVENLVPACASCNRRKGHRHILEWVFEVSIKRSQYTVLAEGTGI